MALNKIRGAAQREASAQAGGQTPEGAGGVTPTVTQVAMIVEQKTAVGAFWFGEAGDAISNHFRSLRRELLAQLQGMTLKGVAPLVLVTSPLPGDGKTFVSSAIARTFANAPDFRVTLLDMDLVRRTISTLFNAREMPGVLDCINGATELRDVVASTDVPRLRFVPAGSIEGDSRETFVGDGLDALLARLRALGPNNLCVLDAPPVLPVVETALLAAKVDLVLLVVRAGVTPRAAVLDSIAKLGANAKVCVVLNGVIQSHTGEYYDYSNYSSRHQSP